MEPFVLHQAENGCEVLLLNGLMNEYAGGGVTAGFTTRRGGVSREAYGSLNCGLHVADEPGDVVENRRRLADAIGTPFEACTYAEQVHGKEIQVVTRAWRGAGRDSREAALQGKDGFVTNERGIMLHALFADCVPLFFYDPIRGAIGLAHAGWKGTVQRIAAAVVETMSAAYGTKPRDVRAAIGPSIGSCCYEVDEQVMARVQKTIQIIGPLHESDEGNVRLFENTPNEKYLLNLQQLNRQIMIKAGIVPSHIEITGLCTSCRTDLFYSHRKENGKTGRMAAWIGLRE